MLASQQTELAIERPYELPQRLYSLWYDVGQRLGPMTQASIFVALTDPHFRVYDKKLSSGERAIVQAMAAHRGVQLQFM